MKPEDIGMTPEELDEILADLAASGLIEQYVDKRKCERVRLTQKGRKYWREHVADADSEGATESAPPRTVPRIRRASGAATVN